MASPRSVVVAVSVMETRVASSAVPGVVAVAVASGLACAMTVAEAARVNASVEEAV